MGLESNRPLFGRAFEASSLEDLAFEPNGPRKGIVNASLLGDTPLEPEKIFVVDGGLVVPKILLLGGVEWIRRYWNASILNQTGPVTGSWKRRCWRIRY